MVSPRASVAGPALAAATLAGLAVVAACSWSAIGGDPAPRPPSPTRSAAADACTVVSQHDRALGLPQTDAETVRIAPDVVGEKLTWSLGPRRIIAWVGVDALEEFEDLDFVTVHRPAGQPREWTTRVRPELFLAEAETGHPAPCDLLYVSTEGLPGDAPRKVLADLTVRMGPGEDLVEP